MDLETRVLSTRIKTVKLADKKQRTANGEWAEVKAEKCKVKDERKRER